jgi:hypothetical protein
MPRSALASPARHSAHPRAFTGNLTGGGFGLKGGPALLVFAIIAAYFVVFIRFLGSTPWQRLLRAR